MSDSLTFDIQINESLPQALDRLTLVLKDAVFGILTRIDIQDVLKSKIDVDFQPYTILGVCNPHLAHKALSQSSEVGIMLPCPVTLEEKDESTTIIRVGNPDAFIHLAGFADNPVLCEVAEESKDKLQKAVRALQSTPVTSVV